MDVFVRLTVVAVIALSCCGCQSPDPSIELLESELRWMEDQLYALDQQLDHASLQLASCQRNNSSLRQELAAVRGAPATDGVAPRSRQRPPDGDRGPTSPGVRVPDAEDFGEDELAIPQVELGPSDGTAPDESVPPEIDPSAPPLDDQGSGASPEAFQSAEAAPLVARIVLNRRLTGGYDFDGQPGDEGLLVVVEPQNPAGEYVPLPGDLVVEVFDPRVSGPAGRLARWEFDASETLPYLKKSLLGQGIHLQLPWPNRPPGSDRLRVRVTYRLSTGQTLTARREIRVDVLAHRTKHGPTPGAVAVDTLVPKKAPQAAELLSDQMLQPPSGPIAFPAARDREPLMTTPSPRRPQLTADGRWLPSAGSRVPQWSPHRESVVP